MLIGTDCPTIDVGYVKQAFLTLSHQEVVLGPAEDGGYVLIGMKQVEERFFTQIDWGTSKVCEQTCRRFVELGLDFGLLPLAWDVDNQEDYLRYTLEKKAGRIQVRSSK